LIISFFLKDEVDFLASGTCGLVLRFDLFAENELNEGNAGTYLPSVRSLEPQG